MDLVNLATLVEKCVGYMRDGRFPVEGKPEALTKQYLVEPLLKLLGWSGDPSQEYHYASEFSGGMDKKWEDLVPMQHDMPLMFVETKELFAKKLLTDQNVNELLNYMKEYNRKNKNRYRVDWGVLTNFKEIHIFYVSDTKPFFSLSFDLYIKEATQISELLSVESIKRHGIDLFYSENSKEKLGDAFLEDLKKWRLILANGFFQANTSLSVEELRETSQQVLDRLIFIRALETLGILPPNWLGNIFAQWQQGRNHLNKTFSEVIRERFADIESLYDTELFLHRLCDDLPVDDDYLEEILKIQGPAKRTVHETIRFVGQTTLDDKGIYGYNFNTLTFDIMGSAYEKYLAHKITIKEQEQRVAIEETKELRRREGVYFTPTYVVKHVVALTIDARLKSILDNAKQLLLDRKFLEARHRISEVSSLRILDPTCGSGSFLIKAFDAIAACYSDYNRVAQEAVDELFRQRGMDATSQMGFDTVTVADIGERILLENLYGVDFDPQAVEITKLNLWIRMLTVAPDTYRPLVGKRQKKLLPSLMTKIKCGNSLFSPVSSAPSVEFETLPRDLAELVRSREEQWKIVLELSPAHSANKTDDEIVALKRRLDSLSEEEEKCRVSIVRDFEKQIVAEGRRYFGVENGHYLGLQGLPFTWQLEFPEVFFGARGRQKQEPGFDVVIGNLPHGADLTTEERNVIEECYDLGKGYKNTAFLFIERAHEILKPKGQLSLIIPKSFTFSQEWEKVRNFALDKFALAEIADISKAFKGVLLEQVVLTATKGQLSQSSIGIHLRETGSSPQIAVPVSLCRETGAFPIHLNETCLTIHQKIRLKTDLTFKDVTETFRGLPIQSRVSEKKQQRPNLSSEETTLSHISISNHKPT